MADLKVVEFDSSWANTYKELQAELKQIFGKFYNDSKHIGSTVVEGLSARPIIDILLILSDLNAPMALNSELLGCNYSVIQEENSFSDGAIYVKKDDEGTVIAKIYILGENKTFEKKQYESFILALRKYPELKDEYSEIKKKLALEFADDDESYNNGKSEIMAKILVKANEYEKAKANRLPYAGIGACLVGVAGFFIGTAFGFGVAGLAVGIAVGIGIGIGLAYLDLF